MKELWRNLQGGTNLRIVTKMHVFGGSSVLSVIRHKSAIRYVCPLMESLLYPILVRMNNDYNVENTEKNTQNKNRHYCS